MYVVMGASGNVGGVVARRLLDAGKTVRVLGRSAENLQALIDRGADARAGSIDDRAFLTDALSGATAVFAIIPNNFTAPDFRAYCLNTAEIIAAAVKDTGVRYVVAISNAGAELSEGTGLVLGVHDFEQRLNQLSEVNIVYLRVGYFMENLWVMIPRIQQMGVMASALRGDLPIPLVATRDVGAVASEYLLKLDFSGHIVSYVLGQRDVSLNEAAPIIGAAIGKPDLGYMQIPYEAVQQGMLQFGMGASMVRSESEFTRGINEGRMYGSAPRTPESTTPTSIEDFAPLFAQDYSQQ